MTTMPSTPAAETETQRLAALDHAHLWHPFTAMKQWREQTPMIIDRAEGFELINTDGHRYIDGVSSLWCNVHGHRDPDLDRALREQLDKVAHTTMLGLSNPPAIEFAAMLADYAPGGPMSSFHVEDNRRLMKTFYSDAGATALEVAFKMAVGYWHHNGRPEKTKFVGLAGAYHGDTAGAMSVGYSELFHRPFFSMVFPVTWFASPDPVRPPEGVDDYLESQGLSLCQRCHARGKGDGHGLCGLPTWPSECPSFGEALREACLKNLDHILSEQGHETAAVVVEPLMQGAAGMVCQPEGFLAGVRALCDKHDVLLVADEVAVGFGRTGRLFACEHEKVVPDLLCLAKGISGGYLPLAATMVTDAVDAAFTGELSDRRTLFHGHTYTGNPLACAVAIESLKKFRRPVAKRSEDARSGELGVWSQGQGTGEALDAERFSPDLLTHIRASASLIKNKLEPLRESRRVADIRQRGIMVGIEVCEDRAAPEGPKPFDFAALTARRLTNAMREHGVIVRNLGDVVILMPIPATPHDTLDKLCDAVVRTILEWPIEA